MSTTFKEHHTAGECQYDVIKQLYWSNTVGQQFKKYNIHSSIQAWSESVSIGRIINEYIIHEHHIFQIINPIKSNINIRSKYEFKTVVMFRGTLTCFVDMSCNRGFSFSATFVSAGRKLVKYFEVAVSQAALGPLHIQIFMSKNKI